MTLGGRRTNRLIAVKAVLNEFIERRQGDRIGLVLFGDAAYLQAPLTFDHKTVAQFLNEATLGLVGTQTAIGDGIGVSVKHMLTQKTEQKVLILLTDGTSNSGKLSPEEASKVAAQNGVTVYTVGVGTTDLNENALNAIAQATGGKYFRATNTQMLANIYQIIDELEPVASDQTFFRPVYEKFHYPLAAALLLALLAFLFALCERVLPAFKRGSENV